MCGLAASVGFLLGLRTWLLSKAQWTPAVVLLCLRGLMGSAPQLIGVLRTGQFLEIQGTTQPGSLLGCQPYKHVRGLATGALAPFQLKTPVFLLEAGAGLLPGPLQSPSARQLRKLEPGLPPSLCTLAYAPVLGI